MTGYQRGRAAFEPNLVPIADALMLIALCFLTVIEYGQIRDLARNIKDLQLPKSDMAHLDELSTALRIAMLEDGDGECGYIFDGEFRDLNDLELTLELEAIGFRDPDGYCTHPVVLRVDKRLEFEHVQPVMEILRKTKYWKLSFACAKKAPQFEPELAEWPETRDDDL